MLDVPGPRVFTPGELSIEFVNVGGWLTFGDLALDSCAQFLVVAEHRLSRARSIGHQLRNAGFHFVWAPACQDHVGVILGLVLSVLVCSLITPIIRHASVSGVLQVGSGFENQSSYFSKRSGSSFL